MSYDLSIAVPAGQHRRAVLDQHQGEAARTAAQPGDHRLDRIVRDGLRRHQHRRQGRAPHRRPAGDDRPSHRRPRRGRQRGQARLRGARRHREEGQHPGRLLQGREEDRGDLQDLSTACATRFRATTPRSRRTAPSRCWAAARCRSTAAARRSTPKRSRPRSRVTRTCSTRWSSVCPTRASATTSPPSSHRREGTRPTLAELDTFVRKEIAGYKVPRSLWLVDEVKRSPAGKPDYRWAKEQTEERPADDVHAKHVGCRQLMHTELCDRFGIAVPDLRLHPVGEGGRCGQPGRRAGCARLRPVQRSRRARDRPAAGWTRTPTVSRTASTS